MYFILFDINIKKSFFEISFLKFFYGNKPRPAGFESRALFSIRYEHFDSVVIRYKKITIRWLFNFNYVKQRLERIKEKPIG